MRLLGDLSFGAELACYRWSEIFLLAGFLLGYGLLLVGVFALFWRWAGLTSYQGLISTLRQGRGVFWQRLTLFVLVCFTGLPPVFFFFNKLGFLIFLFQTTTTFQAFLVLLFLVLGWYAYFMAIRWLSLTQVALGYSRSLLEGLFSPKVVILWVFFSFFFAVLVFLFDDFLVCVSWLFL
jgi:hypothetical protein